MEIIRIAYGAIVLYTAITFIVSTIFTSNLSKADKIKPPLIFMGTIILFGFIIERIDNDLTASVVGIIAICLTDTLIILFCVNNAKNKKF